jgi:alpha-beta hydrolase superfamily lysophospholipase
MVTARRFDLSYHEIFNEPDRQTAIDDVISWLRSRAGG